VATITTFENSFLMTTMSTVGMPRTQICPGGLSINRAVQSPARETVIRYPRWPDPAATATSATFTPPVPAAKS